MRSKCPYRCIGCMLIMGIAVWGRIGGACPIWASEPSGYPFCTPLLQVGGAAHLFQMLAGSPSVSTPKEMDRVIGRAAFSVLAQARVRLSQIRAKGEDPLAVQLELTPGRGR